MPGPSRQPVGLNLTQTARIVGRAFDSALAAAGGSAPVWQILLTLETRDVSNQRELADVVGIQGATLTHHLNAMEADGLVTRTRDPENRRIHVVRLTDDGHTVFHRLREAAVAFDARLRGGLTDPELRHFETVLARLRDNVVSG